jgi:hypothetical protein
VNRTSSNFADWFWISLAMGILFATLLFVAARRRDIWLRYTAAEAEFWLRLGFPPRKFVEAARRIEEGRMLLFLLWFLVLGFLILTLINGSAYLHYQEKLRGALPVPVVIH